MLTKRQIINDVPTAQDNPPYIRAVQRDLKNYIAQHAPRTIPVGYSAADVREVLQDTWEYLQCSIGNNDTSRSDFFGLNSYSWCGGDATFDSSGYNTLVEMFGNTTIPVFFSEYGCNQVTPRVFDEVQALYGPQMTVLSGGLVYEWSQEPSNYGLVNISSNGDLYLLTDYDNLQNQYNKLNVTLLESSNSTATSLNPPACASSLISNDGFSTDFNIPSPPQGADALIASGVSNPPSGSIVPVTNTAVPFTVYASNGGTINDLAIRPVNGSNTPSGANTGASASGSASPSGSSTASGTSSGSSSATASATASGAASSATASGAASSVGVATGSLLAALFGVGVMAL